MRWLREHARYSIERQTGLKLEKQNHPMPVMVIDHLERVPVEN